MVTLYVYLPGTVLDAKAEAVNIEECPFSYKTNTRNLSDKTGSREAIWWLVLLSRQAGSSEKMVFPLSSE